jgi:hypothetical protein
MTAINALRYLFAFLICSWSGTSDDDDFDGEEDDEKCLDVVVVVVVIAEAVSRGIECPWHLLPPLPTPLPLLGDEKKEAVNREEEKEEEEEEKETTR